MVISGISWTAVAFGNHFMGEVTEFKVSVVREIKKTNETLGEVRDGIYELSAGQQVLKESVKNLDRRVSINEELL